MNKAVKDYFKQIKDNPDNYSIEILSLIDKIEYDLTNDLYYFDKEKADSAINWINKRVFDWLGISMTMYQACIISLFYGIRDKKYKLQVYTELVIVIGRGNGKTELVGALTVYNYFVLGKGMKHFYNFAFTKQQAGELSGVIRRILQNPFFEELGFEMQGRLENAKVINDDLDDFVAEIRPLDEASLNGLKITGAVLDEFATWKDAKVYQTILDGAKQNDSTLIAISTAGHVRGGVWDDLEERWQRVLDSRYWDNTNELTDPMLPIIFKGNDIEKWDKEEEIIKANPSWFEPYFKKRKNTITQTLERLKRYVGNRAEFLTKTLNLPVNSDESYFTLEELNIEDMIKTKNESEFSKYEFNGNRDKEYYWFGGIDLGKWDDMTSASLICYDNDEDKFIIINHCWMSKRGYDVHMSKNTAPLLKWVEKGWLSISGKETIDNKVVFEWFMKMREKYYIVDIGYDPSGMNQYLASYQSNGFYMEKVLTNATFMHEPMQQSLEYIRKKHFDTRANQCLLWHLSNLEAVEDNTAQGRIRPDKPKKDLKIDAAVATFNAMSRRLTHKKNDVEDLF